MAIPETSIEFVKKLKNLGFTVPLTYGSHYALKGGDVRCCCSESLVETVLSLSNFDCVVPTLTQLCMKISLSGYAAQLDLDDKNNGEGKFVCRIIKKNKKNENWQVFRGLFYEDAAAKALIFLIKKEGR